MIEEIFNRRITVLGLWLTLAAGGLLLYFLEPGKSVLFPGCPWRAFTGFTCPGCGTTRAFHQLLHGDVLAAFQLNPLFVISIPFLIYFLLRYTNTVMRGQTLKKNALAAKYIWALFVIVLSFWIFRNTPYYPFVS